MSELIQALRGMNDVLPHESFAWHELEAHFMQCVMQYGYQEIRVPVVESTQLFKRTIGEVTDIVEKEMYTFIDLNGDSLSLRPEGTAGCVRACLEHGLLHRQAQKMWYRGPMFRHEKPQKGRYRQFHHLGVEVLGIPGVGIECELLLMCCRLWDTLGVRDFLTLQINTLGDRSEREIYRTALVEYFKQHMDCLDEDSVRRLEKNPLRILDSKNPHMQELIENAPQLLDFLSEASQQHFQNLRDNLDALGITYVVNPRLVRGLDYYGHTVFEWVTDRLGSQATVCAGGRYDVLVEQLGGHPTPAVGWAMGEERLLLLLETLELTPQEPAPMIFMMPVGANALIRALLLADSLRESLNVVVVVNTAQGSFKSQFKKADKSGARFACILGEDEIQQNTISVKALRESSEQVNIAQSELIQYILSSITK